MGYLIASSVLFIFSIIAFIIINGTAQLTLRQIIGRNGYNKGQPWQIRSVSSDLLLFSIISLVIYSPLPPLVTFSVGISIVLIQKLMTWMIYLIMAKRK